MLKKRKSRLLSMCLVAVSLFLCACGGGAETAGEGRTSFTEEELESGHASFQIEENLVVDADITPKSVYGQGFASYNLEVVSEPDSSDEKKFREDSTVLGHSYREFGKMLDGLEPGRLSGKKFMLDEFDIRGTYKAENGKKYTLSGGWSGQSAKYGLESPFNTSFMDMERTGTVDSEIKQRAEYIMFQVPDYEDESLDFLPDPEKTAGQIREFLEKMSGRKVSDRYKYVPVSHSNMDSLEEKIDPFLIQSMKEDRNEYGYYLFWYDIDGLPFYNLELNYKLESDETADRLCYWGTNSSELSALSEHVQMASVDRDGILAMEWSDMREPGSVCREKSAVVGPDRVLGEIQDYYGRKLLLEEAVVTDVQLVYTGYFDNTDGTVRPVIIPVWEVLVRDGMSGTESVSPVSRFVYDAYTGKCLVEGTEVREWY